MRNEKRKGFKGALLGVLILLVLLAIPVTSREVQAAKAGFKTVNGETYYIKANGSKQKGWLTFNGKKYYFNKEKNRRSAKRLAEEFQRERRSAILRKGKELWLPAF